MKFTLYKFRISADNGQTWTEQWLTENEATEERNAGRICERVDLFSFQIIYA